MGIYEKKMKKNVSQTHFLTFQFWVLPDPQTDHLYRCTDAKSRNILLYSKEVTNLPSFKNLFLWGSIAFSFWHRWEQGNRKLHFHHLSQSLSPFPELRQYDYQIAVPTSSSIMACLGHSLLCMFLLCEMIHISLTQKRFCVFKIIWV